MTIDERWRHLNGRPSGFDYMRIALSISVLLWHSYAISYGSRAAEQFWMQNPTGLVLRMIMPVFFALSGFLVSSSMYRNKNVRVFLTLRVIRIFPALAVEIVLSAIILGPIVSALPFRSYVFHHELYSYLLNAIGWIHYKLPGVFHSNPYPKMVNPSLWTVPFELECYIVISILFLAGVFRDRRLVVPSFMAATILVILWNSYNGIDASPATYIDGRVLVLCFLAGVCIYAYRDLIPWRHDLGIAAFTIALLCARSSYFVYIIPVFAAYSTVYVGLLNPPRSIIVDAGDFSYGTYLYAGPLQQTVAQILGASGSWVLNVALALPATILFALFSWWVIEKPFLRVRRYLGARPAPPSADAVQAAIGDPRAA